MHSINPLLKDFIFLTTQYKIEHLKVKKGQIFWLLHNYSIQQYLAGGGGEVGTYPEEWLVIKSISKAGRFYCGKKWQHKSFEFFAGLLNAV